METQIETQQNLSHKAISPKDVVQSIRNRASNSPVFNAMCYVFALRKRTRQQITVSSLYMTMTEEKFKYTKKEYGEELKYMAGLGIGKLERDSKGRVSALKGIKITLQSIGMTALNKADALRRVHMSPDFIKLPNASNAASVSSEKVKAPDKVVEYVESISAPPPKPKVNDYEAVLTVRYDGKTLLFELDKAVSGKDLLAYVSELYAKKK